MSRHQTISQSCDLVCPTGQCSAGIVELLEVAKASVPPSMWNVTLVVLKATAGLRLLPGEKAHHLLDRVRTALTVALKKLILEGPFILVQLNLA